jgi:nucleoside-diphosphate-sugar epimerase
MNIMIAGAAGFIGQRLASNLIAAGHEVTLCGRDTERLQRLFPGHKVCHARIAHDRAEDWASRLEGIRAVINAAGIIRESRHNSFEQVQAAGPSELFAACANAGIDKVIQISALGAAADAGTEFLRSKSRADDRLLFLAKRHSLTGWIVVRPSLVIGRGGASTALFAALAALPRPLRLGAGTWQVQPVHISDFCECIHRILALDEPLPPVLDLVGPEPMSTDTLTGIIRQWLGLAARQPVSIPENLIRLTLPLSAAILGGSLTPGSLEMLKQGNTSSVAPLRAALGWQPRRLIEAIASDPSSQADLWSARLFFPRPLLRLSLAFLWIATAMISAFVFPIHQSLAMVAALGAGESLGTLTIYAASAWDGILGIALLCNFRPALMGLVQIATITGFTLLATIAVPSAWIEPFGPLTKNLPLVLATAIMIALEAKS